MLWTIIAGLVALWLIATVLKFTLGGLIHILLLVALVMLVMHLLKKK